MPVNTRIHSISILTTHLFICRLSGLRGTPRRSPNTLKCAFMWHGTSLQSRWTALKAFGGKRSQFVLVCFGPFGVAGQCWKLKCRSPVSCRRRPSATGPQPVSRQSGLGATQSNFLKPVTGEQNPAGGLAAGADAQVLNPIWVAARFSNRLHTYLATLSLSKLST